MLILSFIKIIITSMCTCDMNDLTCIQKCGSKNITISSGPTNNTKSLLDKNNLVQKNTNQVLNVRSNMMQPKNNGSNEIKNLQNILIKNEQMGVKQNNATLQATNAPLEAVKVPSSALNTKSATKPDNKNLEQEKKADESIKKDEPEEFKPKETDKTEEDKNDEQKAEKKEKKDTEKREKIKESLFSDPLLNSISKLFSSSDDKKSESKVSNSDETNSTKKSTLKDDKSTEKGSEAIKSSNLSENTIVVPRNEVHIPTTLPERLPEKPNLVIIPSNSSDFDLKTKNKMAEQEIRNKISILLGELEKTERENKSIEICNNTTCDISPLDNSIGKIPGTVQQIINTPFSKSEPPKYCEMNGYTILIPDSSTLNCPNQIDTEHSYLRPYLNPNQVLNCNMSPCNHEQIVEYQKSLLNNLTAFDSYKPRNSRSEDHHNERVHDLSPPPAKQLSELETSMRTDPCLFLRILEEYSKNLNFLTPQIRKEIKNIRADFMKQFRDDVAHCRLENTETRTLHHTTTRGILDGIRDIFKAERSSFKNEPVEPSVKLNNSVENKPENMLKENSVDDKKASKLYDAFEDSAKIDQNELKNSKSLENTDITNRVLKLFDQMKDEKDTTVEPENQKLPANDLDNLTKPPIVYTKTIYVDSDEAQELTDSKTITRTVKFPKNKNNQADFTDIPTKNDPQKKIVTILDDKNSEEASFTSTPTIFKTVTVTQTIEYQEDSSKSKQTAPAIQTLSSQSSEQLLSPESIKTSNFTSTPNSVTNTVSVSEIKGNFPQPQKAEGSKTAEKVENSESKDFFGILKQLEDIQSTTNDIPKTISIPEVQSTQKTPSDSHSAQSTASAVNLSDIYSVLLDLKSKTTTTESINSSGSAISSTSESKSITSLDAIPPSSASSLSSSHISSFPVSFSTAISISLPTSSIPVSTQIATNSPTDQSNPLQPDRIVAANPSGAEIVEKCVSQNKIIQEIRQDQKDIKDQLQKIIEKAQKEGKSVEDKGQIENDGNAQTQKKENAEEELLKDSNNQNAQAVSIKAAKTQSEEKNLKNSAKSQKIPDLKTSQSINPSETASLNEKKPKSDKPPAFILKITEKQTGETKNGKFTSAERTETSEQKNLNDKTVKLNSSDVEKVSNNTEEKENTRSSNKKATELIDNKSDKEKEESSNVNVEKEVKASNSDKTNEKEEEKPVINESEKTEKGENSKVRDNEKIKVVNETENEKHEETVPVTILTTKKRDEMSAKTTEKPFKNKIHVKPEEKIKIEINDPQIETKEN